jgi:soluble lytic murein transglycosylase
MRKQSFYKTIKEERSKMHRLILVFLGVALVVSNLQAKESGITDIPELFQQQNYEQVESLLQARIKQIEEKHAEKEVLPEDAKKDLAGLFFALGKNRYQLSKYSEAEADLLQSLDLKSIFPDYNYHFLGLVSMKQGDLSKAKRYFNKVLKYRPRSHLHIESRLQLADIAMANKHWKTARKLLRYVERKKRREPEHPYILLKLADAAVHRNNYWQACRWTRNLYRNYPLHDLTKDWGVSLKTVKIGKFSPRCQETQSDRRSRIRRLLWAGQTTQAFDEIQAFRRISKDDYAADILLVRYYNHKGNVEASLKTLEKHYESKQYNFDYLNKLAKTSAKLGKFPQAVGLYYKAYKLRSRSRKGRDSLFHAAYLSYQFQDYDGASRKFEELIKKFPRSGLARDAHWHTAWIRYLKGDYQGAYKKLSNMWKKRRRYRWSRTITNDKIRYWQAMSLLRMGKKEEAISAFMRLAKKGHFTFYTITSRSRVMELIGDKDLSRTPSSIDFNDFETSISQWKDMEDLKQKDLKEEAEGEAQLIAEEDTLESEEEALAKKEDIEDSIREKEEDKKFSSSGAMGVAKKEKEEEEVEIEDEPLKVTNFKSKIMNQRFERALELMRFGMYDLARWELYDIERRTSNRTYLKTLMEAYQKIGAYHRSAYIGEVYFSSDRSKYGIAGAKYLWDYTYPQAYEREVIDSSSKFGVPPELVWGVMRQESHFRRTIRSPVGATGLMQLMPYTADKVAALIGLNNYKVEMLEDPKTNVDLGTRYLKRLTNKFSNKYPLVVAAYNAGPHRVDAWLKTFGHLDMDEFIEHIPFLETRLYVKKVTQNFHVYELLRNQKNFMLDVATLSQPVGLTYVGKLPTKENWN